MAFIDEVPAEVTAALPNVQEWQDGTDDTLWDTKRSQAQALYNIRNNSAQLTWAVLLHKLLFDAISEDDAADARAGLLTLAAHAVIWADQIDARP
jgi:hypothetical protein